MLWYLLGRNGCGFVAAWVLLVITVGGIIGYVARFLGLISF